MLLVQTVGLGVVPSECLRAVTRVDGNVCYFAPV